MNAAAWHAQAMRWFAARAPRERLLMVILAGLALVALYAKLIWEPLTEARTAARASIRADESLMGRMRAAGPELARRAAAGPAGATTLAAGAAQAGLAIRRIEPDGAGLRVQIEEAPFESLVGWLARVEGDGGMRIAAARIERRPAPGVVNAELRLEP